MTRSALPAIEIQGLVKRYARVAALDSLDLTVAEGETHGFIGPNGSGKSTTLRVLLGLSRADSGTVRVLGADPFASPQRRHGHISYVPGDVELWPNLTGGEIIDLLCRLHGRWNEQRKSELVDSFELDLSKKAQFYSRGNREKVLLVAAFAADSDLMLLDEPTAGLDPLMEEVFCHCVRNARRAGRTILLSSHLLEQVETLCDRVTLIRGGRAVATGAPSELEGASQVTVRCRVRGPSDALAPLAHELRIDGQELVCVVDRSGLTEFLAVLARIGVDDLTVSHPSLAQVFLDQYRDQHHVTP